MLPSFVVIRIPLFSILSYFSRIGKETETLCRRFGQSDQILKEKIKNKYEKDKLDKIEEAWEEKLKYRSENKYVFFDYYNGIAIKNSFPINPAL